MLQCVEVGLVQGKHLSVDGSFVETNAAKESRIPREQLAEAAQVNRTVRQYLVELEQQNPAEEPVPGIDSAPNLSQSHTLDEQRNPKGCDHIRFWLVLRLQIGAEA